MSHIFPRKVRLTLRPLHSSHLGTMASSSKRICCGDSPGLIPLHDNMTAEGWKSWGNETYPDARDQNDRHRYMDLADWYLRDLRRQYPENPYLYIEHVRRSPGHLEGSSKEGAVLETSEYRHLLRYLRLPYDTCPLPPRDKNPFSKANKAVLKRKLSSKGKEYSLNFLQSGSGRSKRPGFVRRPFSFVTRSARKIGRAHV